MKKISTHLTGTVLLVAVLIAGGCKKATGQNNLKKVDIYCKAVIVDGTIQFSMYASNDPTNVGSDIVTNVEPGTRVTWLWTEDSEIQKFVKIVPQNTGRIMPGPAKRVPLTQKLRLKVPNNAPVPSPQEKYDIEFVDEDGHTWPPIDPYLKIPDISQDPIP